MYTRARFFSVQAKSIMIRCISLYFRHLPSDLTPRFTVKHCETRVLIKKWREPTVLARFDKVWRGFTKVWQSLTKIWQSLAKVWQSLAKVWQSLTNVWQSLAKIWQSLPKVWQSLAKVWQRRASSFLFIFLFFSLFLFLLTFAESSTLNNLARISSPLRIIENLSDEVSGERRGIFASSLFLSPLALNSLYEAASSRGLRRRERGGSA